MWGNQGWGSQWALQPAMFNDVPHEQIDWAELAKQWIQMQQTPSEGAMAAPSPPPPVPPVSLPPPPGHGPILPEEFPEANVDQPVLKAPNIAQMPDHFHMERPYDTEPAPFLPIPPESNNFWSKSQWEETPPGEMDDHKWHPPPMEAPAPLIGGKETFDYGHMHDNPPLAMQSIDYNHMSDYSYNQPPVPMLPKNYPAPAPAPIPEAHYDQYWSQVNSAPAISPMFLKKDRPTASAPVEEESQIDAAKRKQLPAWIRDGLEKMEQERLKRLEKERAAQESAEKMAKSSGKDLGSKEDIHGVPISIKSKFDSESEGDDPEMADQVTPRKHPLSEKRLPSPVEDTRTDEEKKQELMFKVRRTLTEILLSVTNSEMISIAQEMFRKAKSRAPARQLASSASMSSVAAGLRGLASYGTESDEASDAEEEDEDNSESEEELYRKIKEKKKLFAVKERKIIAELERREQEKIELEKALERNAIKKLIKEPPMMEKTDDADNVKDTEMNDALNSSKANEEFDSETKSVIIPGIMDDINDDQLKEVTVETKIPETNSKKIDKSNSVESSDSGSSESDSESSEKHKKKSHKESSSKSKSASKYSKKDKSSHKHSSSSSRRKRSRSRDKHKRDRSHDRKSSSSTKKRKRNRSESSSTSSSSPPRKSHSSRSKYKSSHSSRDRRSHSSETRDKKSSRSKSHRQGDGHSSKSSRSHKRDDRHDRRHKDEKRRRSRSPSTKVPRKYRSSRSLSSESGSSGKKSKKSQKR